MRIFTLTMRCLLACAFVQALWASQPFAENAENSFPMIAPGSLYVGDVPEYMEQAWLYLLDDNYFILKKTRSVNGKSRSLSQFTGRWRQIDGGANLQLTNAFGLQLNMNVGCSGNLYSSVQTAAAMSAQTLVMKKAPFSKPLFRIAAVLESHGGKVVLTDSAAGRSFSPVEGDLGNKISNEPIFIEAEVSLLKKGIKIEKIYSSTEKLPSSLRQKDERFVDVAGGGTWQNEPGDGMAAASCYFHEKGAASGILEISGSGLHLELSYRVDQQVLVFMLASGNKVADMSPEAHRWLEVLRGEIAWRHEGDLLVLHSRSGRSVQFHKVGR